MDLTPSDTICALSTPPGRGGIGIIRVSGPATYAIIDALSTPLRSWKTRIGHTLHRARIVDADDLLIDDVLLAVFHAPRSYTGEDVVEIHAHGGPIPLRRILARLYSLGARAAAPGEFTQRAFLNGKLDLAQAEAVADIIEADTVAAHRLALQQQTGALSRAVEGIRDIVLGVLARIEASIDFPEDVGELDYAICRTEIVDGQRQIIRLLSTTDAGILRREGIKVVLIGRPNVGKSSLMNALLRADRSIVTAVPGTTRDIVEEAANIAGVRTRILDTAGVRDTTDAVERIGVERTRASMEQADLILHILDATSGRTVEDLEILQTTTSTPNLIVWNKCDAALPEALPGEILLSALTGMGLDILEKSIADSVLNGDPSVDDESAVVTHSRHRYALETARERLEDAVRTIDGELPPDFVSIDVRGALVALGEITGATATEDIINEIFSRFCIGK